MFWRRDVQARERPSVHATAPFGGASRTRGVHQHLDAIPPDGFTDSPPFLSTDAVTLNPVIPEEILVPQIKLHTVAFRKTFLEGDHRYMRYLTAGSLEAMICRQ